jgi:PAS domain S-box-containing protein
MPVRNEKGEIALVLVEGRDITARKEAEEKLHEASQFNKQIITSSPDGLIVIDRDFRYLVWNPQMEAITGLLASEVLGKRPMDLFPFLETTGIYGHLERAFAGEAVVSEDFFFEVPSTGRKGWNMQVAGPLRNAHNEIIGVLVSVIDITARKSAELIIEQERLRLAGIINSAMDGIIMIDESQKIMIFNPAAEDIFRYRAEEVIGRSIEVLIPSEARLKHAELVREFGRSNFRWHEMGKGRRISGLRSTGEEFPLEASISQVTLNGQKFFTVTCRDVTERVRADETRKKLEAQLLQSQKMEAIGLLAGGVAHDFNNLLTVISGYGEVLLQALAADESLNEPAKAIMEACARAASLTRQLLVFSRQRVSETKIVDLNAIVSDAEKMLRRVIGEDIHFTVSLDPTIGSVKAEPAQLNQVLMNLVVNARDAMPKGGQLTIETRSVLGSGSMQPSDTPPEQFVLLTVADTGIGIPPETVGRIFEPFFTTKGLGKGTGLGLAVVHGIVEQSGGRIEVATQPGVGTTFQIFLPSAGESLSTVEHRESTASSNGTETILLVEDDNTVRELAVFSLVSQGYRIVTANDGLDALRTVEDYPNRIDMLLTDVVMPNLDGIDLANIVRVRYPDIKILFMSGYSGESFSERSGLREDTFLLQKPYTPTSLVRKVREVLDRARVSEGLPNGSVG